MSYDYPEQDIFNAIDKRDGPMNPIIGSNVNQGVTVSTVYLSDRGWWETCLFDDRNGRRYGNQSRVVDGYGTESDAIAGHRKWTGKTLAQLLDAIKGQDR